VTHRLLVKDFLDARTQNSLSDTVNGAKNPLGLISDGFPPFLLPFPLPLLPPLEVFVELLLYAHISICRSKQYPVSPPILIILFLVYYFERRLLTLILALIGIWQRSLMKCWDEVHNSETFAFLKVLQPIRHEIPK
jgi:hypothetical protein